MYMNKVKNIAVIVGTIVAIMSLYYQYKYYNYIFGNTKKANQ